MASTVAERAQMVWCMRLNSALRTALACAIVGGATLYGPKFLADQIKFAAFSYLTAVIIVSDATLGDTLRGCWHAFCATAQVVPLAMLLRWLVDPTDGQPVSMAVAAAAAAGSALLVALPECTHLTAKRIAFGQIVLVCTDAVLNEDRSVGFMHPAHVTASTALGAMASVLALLIPYPGLATDKVRKLCRVYAENASQRMNLYLRAFSSQDIRAKKELISQASILAETGAKLLHSIRILQEGMQWERPWGRYSKLNSSGPGDRLQSMELQLRGIEYSLISSLDFPDQVVDHGTLSNVLKGASVQIEQKIEQVSSLLPFQSMNEADTRRMEKPSLSLEPIPPMVKHGWVLFYFSCIERLLNDAADTDEVPTKLQTPYAKTEFSIAGTLTAWILKLTIKERLEFALKCSLSLGLAVLFGLIFDKKNGCWAGLSIAISFVTGKQAVFTVANTRAQGTAIGSVYGVICCFLFHYEALRLLALLPWIIFSSFLRYSKMYGQSGGVSAAIGALLILGRKNYGAPNEFALGRVTEVFIGLSVFIVVELSLQPTRAAGLAKNHLYKTLSSLQDCIREMRIYPVERQQTAHKILELRGKQSNLNSLVCELKRLVADTELEPDFWYLPFRASCYQKLAGSLSNIVDMLYFIIHNFEIITELSESSPACKEFHQHMNGELEPLQETLNSSLKYLKKARCMKSPREGSHEQTNGTTDLSKSHEPADELTDLEMGKKQHPENQSMLLIERAAAERTTEEDKEDNKDFRETTIQCLSTTWFCVSALTKEIDEAEICVREIALWEKHSIQ